MLRHLHLSMMALASLLALTQPSAALPGRIGQGLVADLPAGGHLTDGIWATPPRSFLEFCNSYPDQCAAGGGRAAIALDARRWEELLAVNADVNARISPEADEPGHDIWSIGAESGDCDDYAVEKRRELIDLGWPVSALSLTIAFVRNGQAHLVLTVRTDRGDLVLDNLRSRVLPIDRVHYRWIARQSDIHPRLWVRVATSAQTSPRRIHRPIPGYSAALERAAEVDTGLATTPAR